MVSEDEARALALAMPGAEERSHSENADFRVRGKIFATLPAADRMVVRIEPAAQTVLLAADPAVFSAAAGTWGLRGWTIVQLSGMDHDTLADLIADSWRRLAPRKDVAVYDLADGTKR